MNASRTFFLKVILKQALRFKPTLSMAEFGKPGEPEQYIPKISQETLAEMIGTTRSRGSFFMNRFRKLGFIEYNGRIKVHRSLLNAVLLDRLSEVNPNGPSTSATART